MSLHPHDFVIIWYILLIKSIVKTPLPWVTTVTFKYQGSLHTRFSFQFQFRTDAQEIFVTILTPDQRNLQEIGNDNEILTWKHLETMKGSYVRIKKYGISFSILIADIQITEMSKWLLPNSMMVHFKVEKIWRALPDKT